MDRAGTAGRGRRVRAGLARLWAALAGLLVALLALGIMGGPPAHAAAAPSDEVQVSLERAEEYESADNPNAVLVAAILRDKAGKVPAGTFRVFNSVAPYLPDPGVDDTPSKPEPCRQPHFSTNPEIDEGVFWCSYEVDFPDTWTFDVTVYKQVDGVYQKAAHTQATFPVSDAVVLKGLAANLRYAVHASPFTVGLRNAHAAASGIWLIAVAAMALQAAPRLRRLLSAPTLYRLEMKRAAVQGAMWGAFGVVLVSGLYLLGTRTPYGSPWSASDWGELADRPYGLTYFIALYLKILAFVAMGLASVVLAVEAARQSRLAGGADEFDASDDEFWRRLRFHDAMRDSGERVASRRTDLALAPPPVAAGAGLGERLLALAARPRTMRWCLAVVAGGMLATGVCVTVVKYAHELIEMVLAAQKLADAK